MTTRDVVYSLRFSLIKILPEPEFEFWSTAGESSVLTARLHMLQFLFHLFLVNFAFILQKLTFVLSSYWQTIHSHMQYSFLKNSLLYPISRKRALVLLKLPFGYTSRSIFQNFLGTLCKYSCTVSLPTLNVILDQ